MALGRMARGVARALKKVKVERRKLAIGIVLNTLEEWTPKSAANAAEAILALHKTSQCDDYVGRMRRLVRRRGLWLDKTEEWTQRWIIRRAFRIEVELRRNGLGPVDEPDMEYYSVKYLEGCLATQEKALRELGDFFGYDDETMENVFIENIVYPHPRSWFRSAAQ